MQRFISPTIPQQPPILSTTTTQPQRHHRHHSSLCPTTQAYKTDIISSTIPITYTIYRTGPSAAAAGISPQLLDLFLRTNIIQPIEERHKLEKKVQIALKNSLTCVAAFTEESNLPLEISNPNTQTETTDNAYDDDHNNNNTATTTSISSWLSSTLANPNSSNKKRLIGFARAVGDGALVATLHDIVVLPELQRHGIGTTILARLTQQLYSRGIVDVGVLIPRHLEGFFEQCSFGDDTEGSTTMILLDKELILGLKEVTAVSNSV